MRKIAADAKTALQFGLQLALRKFAIFINIFRQPIFCAVGIGLGVCRQFVVQIKSLERNVVDAENLYFGGADRTFVEYVLQDYNRPMGVATYKTNQEKLKELLPEEDEMKKLL